MSYFIEAADNTPGANRDTVLDELGVATMKETRRPSTSWKDLFSLRTVKALGLLAKVKAQQKELPAQLVECHQRLARHKAILAAPGFGDQTLEELVKTPLVEEDDWRASILHIRVSQFAVSNFTLLRNMTRDWLDDPNGVLASELVTGLGVMSADPAFELYAIARVIEREPHLTEAFARETDDRRLYARLAADDSPAAARFRDKLAAFLERFGHRGVCEAELRNLCWRDDPAQVIGHLRNHLALGSTPPTTIVERQRKVGEAARKKALARVGLLRRSLFAKALEDTRHFMALREETKDLLMRLADMTRTVVHACGRRLLEQGFIDDFDDVHFFVMDEIARIARGEIDRDQAHAIIARRRRDYAWSESVRVPKEQKGAARYLEGDEALPEGAAALRGLGVSPGRVTGTARVLLDPRDGCTLVPGEILVAPFTDVAWTPLFLNAAGLVVDVGGLLSHGSIVAREYGIPAVVGVGDATRRIRTGDRIEVDGSGGVVTVLEQPTS